MFQHQYEGFPNILLDVANSNIPIIAYNCDYGPSEILKMVNMYSL